MTPFRKAAAGLFLEPFQFRWRRFFWMIISKRLLLTLLVAGSLGYLHFRLLPRMTSGYNDPCVSPLEERDALRHLVRGVIRTLERLNQTYWIDHGTLLGAVRDRDLLPYDHDADIGRLHYPDHRETLFRTMLKAGFRRENISGDVMMASYQLPHKRITCDLFRYDVITRNTSRGRQEYLQEYYPFKVTGVDRLKYVVVETVFPKDLFLPTVRIPFLGMMVQAPRRYMELLKRRYPYTWGWTFPYKWKCWVPFLS